MKGKITFDDKTQTLWYVFRSDYNGKEVSLRIKEHIECPKEYFRRKLKGE